MTTPKEISSLTASEAAPDMTDPALPEPAAPAEEPAKRPVGARGRGPVMERVARPGPGRQAANQDMLRERRIERMGGRRAKAEEPKAEADGDDQPQRAPATRGPTSTSADDQKAPGAVRPAQLRQRHYGVILSFLAMVILPIALSGWYLWTRAVDQYESHVGFAVRAEGQSATPDLFGGLLGAPTSSTSEDMSILNEYILSQEIVTLIDAKLDLRARFSVPKQDPVFAFDTSGTVEDLVAFWQRMVKVDYNASSGLMELTIYAFAPQDAQDIAAAVLEESNKIINNLSAIAREDSTRFARETLENARARASEARSALAEFRQNNKVADPTADITSQMGVVNSLQQQLATALVELDLIRASGKANDPRIVQLERRISAIEGRIDQERSNLGVGANGAGFAEVLSEYERLNVEKSFAEQTYLAALAGFDSAMSSAAQQSRYLANYVPPTLAQASTAPNRPLVVLVIGLIAFFVWSSLVLIYYALRDRR